MVKFLSIRRVATVFAAGLTLLVAACNTPPAFQVTQPASRDGVVESIVQGQQQRGNATGGAIAGAVIGGLLGNQVGGGSGKTVATVVGAGAGAVAGNQVASQQTIVWQIGVRYDDGSRAVIEQTASPAIRVGDRVRVTANGIQQL
jgi:outer membrane lipoprotein SlyB